MFAAYIDLLSCRRLSGPARIYGLDAAVWNGGMKRHYSPQIDRDLVSALYHEAKARGIPMTRLANRLLQAALCYEGVERENAARKISRLPRNARCGSGSAKPSTLRLKKPQGPIWG